MAQHKKYKNLIFDLDDTLIDNFENVKYAFGQMMQAKGQDYTEADFLRWYEIDKNFWREWQDGKIELPERFRHETGKKSDAFLDWLRAQRVLRFFDHRITLEEATRLNNVFMQALTERIIPIDGATETLANLSQNYRIIVATNGPKIATKDKLEKIGASPYVDKILSADMFGYMKPLPEFFEGIKNTLSDQENQNYLIIGDSLKSDIGLAMTCGVDSCWFNRINDPLPDNYTPTYTITHLTDLNNLL